MKTKNDKLVDDMFRPGSFGDAMRATAAERGVKPAPDPDREMRLGILEAFRIFRLEVEDIARSDGPRGQIVRRLEGAIGRADRQLTRVVLAHPANGGGKVPQ